MSGTIGRRAQLEHLYSAFVAGDFEGLREGLAPDVEYVNPHDAVEPGTQRGPAAFVEALGRLHDMFHYDGFEITDLIERDERMVAVIRFTARGRESDVPIDAEFAHLLTWNGPQLARLEWFRDGRDAVAALG